MTLCTADFEKGTNGSNVLAADPGSATAFDSVSAVNGATVTYDSLHAAHGSLGAKFSDSGVAGVASVAWSTSFGTVTDYYGRLYLFLTANPGSQMPIFQGGQGATRGARIDVNTTGRLTGFDNPASALFPLFTNPIALNQWVRIEFHIICSATVGQAEVKLFNTADSTTPTETQTGTANKNTLANHTSVSFGSPVTTIPSGYSFWMDDIVAGAAAYPGPAVAAPVNTVAPAVTGTATVGQTLATTNGTWAGTPTGYTYQWQTSPDNVTFSNIAAATASSYTLVSGDVSHYIRCVVTATNAGGSTAANSNSVGPVAAAPAVSGPPIASDSAQTAHDKLVALGYSADEASRLQAQWTHES